MRKRVTAAVAYLSLAVHVCALAHVLVVRHATCPSHGEVVHGGAAAVPGAEVAHQRADTPPDATATPDEHCLLVASGRRDDAALAPAGAAWLVPAPAPAPIHLFTGDHTAGVAL